MIVFFETYPETPVSGWEGKGVGQYSAANGHLGQDYYLVSEDSAGKPVFAVANGQIIEVLNGPGQYGWCDDDDHGWGPVVVIKHVLSSGFKVPSLAVKDPGSCGSDLNPTVIYSLYGHLSKESISNLFIGQKVDKGQPIGTIGKYGVDLVSWTTNHLHFELKDELGFKEGTWYKSNPGTCPGSITYKCSQREIKGVGTGYSEISGFAPHRYDPSLFIPSNMLNPQRILLVVKAGTGIGTITGDEINCGSNCWPVAVSSG
jgi:murein DD-endopeptidase MepM/ murein hydrolase activator NlpD